MMYDNTSMDTIYIQIVYYIDFQPKIDTAGSNANPLDFSKMYLVIGHHPNLL